MKKILLTICSLLLLTGCGHTVYTASKGIGIDLSWNPDTFVPSFRGGEYDVVSFVPRGNSNMSMTTCTGGVLGTGGTSQTMTVSTGIQFNEGNITKVFTNPFIDNNTKTQLAKALPAIIQRPAQPAEISARTTYAAGATGPKAVYIKPQATGTDKIVDKISDNASAIKDVANTVVKTTGDATKASIITAILATKWMLIAIVIAAIFIVALLVIIVKYFINYFQSKKITATIPVGKLEVKHDDNSNQFLSNKKQ